MQMAEAGVVAGGGLTLLIAIGHTFFHRLFGWGPELERLSPRNRRVLYTIHVALYLLFLPVVLVSLRYPRELTRPGLGGTLALSLAVFWSWRLVWQVVYFGPLLPHMERPWRRFHHALVALCVVLVASYGGAAVAAWRAAG